MIRVPSSDGVGLVVHDLAGDASLPALLISHATGFHARCYLPIAESLADRYHSVGPDYRGHGDTAIDPNWQTDWSRFGDDAIAAAHAVAGSRPITGFGHSMGGAALLMAAHREPSLFDRLVLFEPIVYPAAATGLTDAEVRETPIVRGALRRRRTFASFDAAYDNYREKPPLSLMTPAALRSYVDHGFRETLDEHGEPAVTLKCTPEVEAGIFMTARSNGLFDLLPQIETPCLVIAGRVEADEPSSQTSHVAERLPNADYLQLDHQTHFGPFSHPDEIADLIAG